MESPKVMAFMRRELDTDGARGLLSEELVSYLLECLKNTEPTGTSAAVPRQNSILKTGSNHLKRFAKKWHLLGPLKEPLHLEPSRLAYRACVICGIHRLFTEDAAAGRRAAVLSPPSPPP